MVEVEVVLPVFVPVELPVLFPVGVPVLLDVSEPVFVDDLTALEFEPQAHTRAKVNRTDTRMETPPRKLFITLECATTRCPQTSLQCEPTLACRNASKYA